jgi:hypothetical protein
MSGIEQLAEMITTDLEQRLPGQRKTQRDKLALLVATMLQVKWTPGMGPVGSLETGPFPSW